MKPKPTDFDRVLHAVHPDGAAVARYDHSGKWYLEPVDGTRTQLTLAQAVASARQAEATGGAVYLGRAGGATFDAAYRRATAQGGAAAPAPSGPRQYPGTRWVTKDGKRTVVIESEISAFRGERHFMAHNAETGRSITISIGGLTRKYHPITD